MSHPLNPKRPRPLDEYQARAALPRRGMLHMFGSERALYEQQRGGKTIIRPYMRGTAVGSATHINPLADVYDTDPAVVETTPYSNSMTFGYDFFVDISLKTNVTKDSVSDHLNGDEADATALVEFLDAASAVLWSVAYSVHEENSYDDDVPESISRVVTGSALVVTGTPVPFSKSRLSISAFSFSSTNYVNPAGAAWTDAWWRTY